MFVTVYILSENVREKPNRFFTGEKLKKKRGENINLITRLNLSSFEQ